jgi:ferritin-like metal-binding protein YciE
MANTKSSNKGTARSSSKKKASNAGAGAGNTQLETFFIDSLKDIYWAEKALTKALPKMQKKATTEELREALATHLEQTQEQIERLDQVFELMGKKAQAKKCEAMEGLIAEAESVMEDTEDGSMTRDVAIIMAAQKVEHYEIATYGSLVTLANTMGNEDVADLLRETLEEEKETDSLLTTIAESNITWAAEAEDEGEEEEE